MTDHTDLIQRLREKAIIKPGRSNRLDHINPDGPEAADALKAQATHIAELEAALKAARTAQIARGDVLSTSGAEARWIEDTESACRACGGSGHQGDVPGPTSLNQEDEIDLTSAYLAGERRGAKQMRDAVIEILRQRISHRQMHGETFSQIVHENVLSCVERLPLPPAPQEGDQ